MPPDPAGVVMVTEQEAVEESKQLTEDGRRAASLAKATLPVGVVEPPVTMALHVEDWPTNTGLTQVTLVAVVLGPTVMVAALATLAL